MRSEVKEGVAINVMRVAVGILLTALLLWAGGPGFRTQRLFEEHFQKHGREFGSITAEQYLQFAQDLRDAPAGGPILEVVKRGGIVTRFDRRNSHFGAYNRDGTIRTFFIPNDGEGYFHRQAGRSER
jgi:pyocin large subunit-like protein